jgi:hypothetical protein
MLSGTLYATQTVADAVVGSVEIIRHPDGMKEEDEH